MSRLRVFLQGTALAVALGCALVLVRTVADWRADALRWRAASPVAMDTVAVQAALAARDSARARERIAGAQLADVLRRWEETRGPGSPRGRSGPATVAPPIDVAPPAPVLAVCDELADTCARFRAEAEARAVADSAAAETRRQADSAAAHATIARAQRAAADSIDAARRATERVERSLRRSRAETGLAVVVILAMLLHR